MTIENQLLLARTPEDIVHDRVAARLAIKKRWKSPTGRFLRWCRDIELPENTTFRDGLVG